MGLKGESYGLLLFYGTVLWSVTYLITSCSPLPTKHESTIEDDHSLANFSAIITAPLITPVSPEIILDVKSNQMLQCEANEPITWQALRPIALKLNQTLYAPMSIILPYRNELYLNDVTADYVGYFYCIKQKELMKYAGGGGSVDFDMLVEDFKAAKIYVFVNDTNVLLVPMEPMHLIVASQNEDIVIPCKPTISDTAVELVTSYQQVHSSETYDQYDPKRGFVIQIQEMAETGPYTCKPQQPSPSNEKEEVEFMIIYRNNESNDPKIIHVTIPEIHSNSHNGHAVEGETFNLTCSVKTSSNNIPIIRWETPLDNRTEDRLIYTNATIDPNQKTSFIAKSVLTIIIAQTSDGGNYKCIVQDEFGNSTHNTYLMTILKSGESYINMSEPNNYYTITTNALRNIMMNVNFRGFPKPSFNWYAPGGRLVEQSKKYDMKKSNTSISLQINNVELFDTGVYVLRANNGIDEKELEFNLFVKAKPLVSIKNFYVQASESARLLCKSFAYPMANITWSYTPCYISPKWPSCENYTLTLNLTENSTQTSKIEVTNELIFKPDQPGRMKCTATNILGTSSNEGYVLIGDFADNITVNGVDGNIDIAEGDEVIITCAALAYYYSADLDWFKNGEMIINGSGVEVISTFSDYSFKKSIKFKSIEYEQNGSYECRARAVDKGVYYDSKFLDIVVHDSTVPVLVKTNLVEQHERALGDYLELICKFEGIPKPNITWYKNDEKLNVSGTNILISEDNSVLKIPYIKPADEGRYKCVASNRLGNTESSLKLKIKDMPGLKIGWIITIVIFIAILIISIIYLGIRVLKERKVLRQMKLAGLANFEEGALEQINPAMSLDEQADLLPYDRRFEFPGHKLKLGKTIGSGAFGVVVIAHAEGIIPEERETVVAVKMVKRTADNEVVKALVSELKIMVHLGQHLNVVNLLGAVTKNIAKREVMVIVEYCRYGNVQNYLLRNRKRFINQINPTTDKIDPSIVKQGFSAEIFEMNRNSENNRRSGIDSGLANSSYCLRKFALNEYQVDGCSNEQTLLTKIPEEAGHSEWRSNNDKTNSTEVIRISTSDLVSWAFQVTRGMDYLSSRKVLHGDLAARNILLCEDNVVKISDFGLARSLYKNENYKKPHEALLPIKWLALESVSDQVFSTYTDVWSFGIMLWEFFSLASVPYPGIDGNQMYLKLKNGYRMEKPPYANQELYEIMLKCWSFNPGSRPLFHELEKKFARLLGEEVTNHYVDLNEPYLKINNEYMQQSEKDYLALMGSPDERAPAPPRYVNGMVLSQNQIDPSIDYFQLNTETETAIVSPPTNANYGQYSSKISNISIADSQVSEISKNVEILHEQIPKLHEDSPNAINRRNKAGASQTDSQTESVGKIFPQKNQRPAEIETSLIDKIDIAIVNDYQPRSRSEYPNQERRWHTYKDGLQLQKPLKYSDYELF